MQKEKGRLLASDESDLMQKKKEVMVPVNQKGVTDFSKSFLPTLS